MQPRKIGVVMCGGVSCTVFSADDADGTWTAIRAGDLILVRAIDSDDLAMALAQRFAVPHPS